MIGTCFPCPPPHFPPPLPVPPPLLLPPFSSTSGLQTLGEEYAQIVQIARADSDSVKRVVVAVPTIPKLVFSAVFHVFGDYLIRRFFRFSAETIGEEDSSPALKRKLVSSLWFVERSLHVLAQLHLAIFYIFPVYRDASKRIAGIGATCEGYDDYDNDVTMTTLRQ